MFSLDEKARQECETVGRDKERGDEIDYYITQFLNGHGYFWSCPRKIGKKTASIVRE